MSKRAIRKMNGARLTVVAADASIQAGGDEGSAATFSMVLYGGGPIRPGGWKQPHPIVLDLKGMVIAQGSDKPIPFNRRHGGDNALVGHGTPKIEANKIEVNDGVFSFDNEHTQEIISASKKGFPWGSSMEATLNGTPQFIKAGQSVRVNNKTFRGPLYVARRSELFAGAFIGSNPADKTTQVSIAAEEKEMSTEVQEWLESRGIECEGLTDEQIKGFEDDYAAIHASSSSGTTPTDGGTVTASEGDDADPDDPVGQMRINAAQEHKRIAGINDIFGNRFSEIAAACIEDEGCCLEAAQLKFDRAELDEDRSNAPGGPAIHASSGDDLVKSDIYAAKMLTDVQPDLRHTDWVADVFGEETVEKSDKIRGQVGFKQLAYQQIKAAGGHIDPFASADDLFKLAFKADQKMQSEGDIFAASAFSTFSITDALSNLAHKMLMREHRDYPSMVDRLCDPVTHTDFKTWTKIRVEGDVVAQKLPAGGEITHGTLADAKYEAKLETHARMLAITRPDLINDDLGAFNTNGRRLGRGQMLAREILLFKTILATTNVGTFFKDSVAAAAATGQDKNVVNRLTSQGAPSSTLLKNAEDLILQMEDDTGNPVMVQPDFILSPTKLRKAYNDLLVKTTVSVYDDNVAAGTARKEQRIENEWLGQFGVEATPWMNQRNIIPGSSDTLSFLVGDRRDAAAVEYITLRGAGSPVIQSAETDFNTLGVQLRTFWDFAFAMKDPRGLIRIEN